MTDVFISYSRKDKEFVQKLHASLQQYHQDTWVDWQDIPITADWWFEIEAGIEGANTFVFIISPDSVTSKVCHQEIEHAVKHNKRLIPLVRRENFEMMQLHPALSKYNWLFFRDVDDFASAFQALIKAIDTDLDHVRTHTHLLVRANEWDKKSRDASYLLRGSALADAEQWLTQNVYKEPEATNLHREYITASLTAETASLLYRNLVIFINNFYKLITSFRRSKRDIFPLLVEWGFYLLATVNIFLVVFDITYIPWRDFYFLKLPQITQIYDPIKGIEPHRETFFYLETVDALEEEVSQTGLQSSQVQTRLKEINRLSIEMVDTNPFAAVGKSGTFEKIRNRMRDRIGNKSAKHSFSIFWSQAYLSQKGWNQEINFFNQKIRPLISPNYYRSFGEDGEPVDNFWLIDLPFNIIFTVELLLHSLYVAKKLNISYGEALRTRWYDYFWLIFTVHGVWLRLLRIIPYSVRSYQLGVVGKVLQVRLITTRIVKALFAPKSR
ncbi:toll/interleukin-1 receptor domain-containing protein [Nostoc sp. NMS2]|uniref:toll/interleukin-1 receptor domain-containing protein n=1 Tax=unclassified Nostoc TaxID=2593658 RepID=UPI003454D953